MTTKPVLIFGQDEETKDATYRQPPPNMEAEQALLGAVLVSNHALNQMNDQLLPEHFYEPVHQRIFEAIRKMHDRGLIANPVTLKHFFEQDEALADIGGSQYLAKLAGAAVTIINLSDYSQTILDLALKRALITIGEEVVNNAFDHKVDLGAEAQIEAAEQSLFNLASEGMSSKSFKPLRSSIAASIRRAELAFKNRESVTGVPSQLVDLDRLLGGFQNSDLIILAGRPSMGKTALATNIAFNACRAFMDVAQREGHHSPQSGGFFSLERSAEQLASRLLSDACGVSSSKFRRGDMNNDEFATIVKSSHEVSSLPFFIDDTPALSISAVRTRARRLKRINNLGLLVVDYLQLLRGSSSGKEMNRVQEISEITQGLKAIAKELDIPVIALSQLSRAVEQRDDKRPQLSDLRESGSIEQDADVVMFVFREEYYLSRKMPREDSAEFTTWQAEMEKVHGQAEVIIAKQRHGPIGNVVLSFESEFTRFGNYTRTDYQVPEAQY